MNNLLHQLDNISHNISQSIQHKWDDLTHAPAPITKQQILFLEEQERARRINAAAQSKLDRDNAKKVSDLFVSVSFPFFKGNLSGGYKRVTKGLEEHERKRRISAKSEATIRKMNANKMSSLIRSLGWPFFHFSNFQGPEYILVDETRLMEEEERSYRTSNPVWALCAKNNAALISNLMRWEWDNAKYFSLGMKRWTRGVEEKERSRRLADKLGMETAIINAYNLSTTIRNLGWPFFVQEEETKVDVTWELEEKERKWRVSHPEEQQIARELAGQMFSGLKSANVDKLEEEERYRRLEDFHEQYAAVAHAKQVSSLISKDTTRLIEEERQFRLQSSEIERKNARRVAHMISGLGMTLSGIKYLEEKERKRRVSDIEWQCVAKENAKKISALLGSDFGSKWMDSLEENERTSRMWNRSQQLTAIRNARFVSRLILAGSNKKLASRVVEEKERARRMLDNSGQLVAMNNAKFIAGLISSNNTYPSFDSLSLEEEERARRISDNLSQAVAMYNAKLVSKLIPSTTSFDSLALEEEERTARLSDSLSQAVAMNNAKLVSSLISTNSSIDWSSLEEEERSSRISDNLAQAVAMNNAKLVSGLISANHAPFNSFSLEEEERSRRLSDNSYEEIAKFNAHKVSSLISSRLPAQLNAVPTLNKPLPAIPIEASLPRAAPADFVPAATLFMGESPVAEMIFPRSLDSAQPSAPALEPSIIAAPIVAPTNTFVSSNTPVAYTTYGAPSVFAAPVATSVYPASGLQLHPLTDADRKKLEKQAQKHSKRAAKESKKASDSIAKAAKLHNKGKDSRATKYEARAEQHSVAAKHHQLWANDLTSDAYSAVGRPAM